MDVSIKETTINPDFLGSDALFPNNKSRLPKEAAQALQ
jgi:hypothetical protein